MSQVEKVGYRFDDGEVVGVSLYWVGVVGEKVAMSGEFSCAGGWEGMRGCIGVCEEDGGGW